MNTDSGVKVNDVARIRPGNIFMCENIEMLEFPLQSVYNRNTVKK